MLKKLLGLSILFFLTGLFCFAQISFEFNSSYFFLKGSEVSGLPSDWMTNNYNSAHWSKSNAPFRYGDGEGGTVLSDMQNKYSTFYLRSTFTVQHLNELERATFSIDYDDGFIIWINGKEVLRQYAPISPTPTSFAPELHESGSAENFTLKISDFDFVEGENLVAVQVFNYSLESSDIFFDLQILATPPLPVIPATSDSLKVVFSHKGGFYNENFSLEMTVPDDSFTLVYTIDGSNPQTSASVKNGGKKVSLVIDPSNNSGRPQTPCFMVRASLVKDGLAPSLPLTQSYIFINSVINQGHPGGGWPTNNVNGQVLDFEMDRDVTQSSTYRNDMDEALLAIPSISVVTDLGALFDSREGIYVNAEEHGIDWERFCSVELLNPDGKEGFNVNAGLRIRGGWSRHDNYAKHAFRLFFRSEYGNGKLRYPLFEEEGVDEFDKIDLRTAQNYAWSNNQGHNTFVREVFSRDTQGEMGHPYTRSRYYHLYLNGMYWGLFQTQERSEARYAASYMGGQPEDYDVIKVNGDFSYTIEATDGNTDKWQEVWNYCRAGFTGNRNYFELEGKNSKGESVKGAEVKVDIDNLIDYMIIIFYTGNFDAPVSKFSGDVNPNNFYALTKRDDKTKGFQFYAHDCEHSLLGDAVSPGIGIEENRVELDNMNVSGFSKFHPQWLHQKLSDNEEYRVRFADRVEKHLFNNGVFTSGNCEQRFEKRAKEIEMAIIAESARWGDGTGGGRAKTKNDDWQPEIDEVLNRYFPYRSDIVIDQLINAGLYPVTAPVVFKVDNKVIQDSRYLFNNNAALSVSRLQSSGDIYITTDGSDPREVGGGVNPEARKVENNEVFQLRGTNWIKARVRRGNEWSPLRELHFIKRYEDYYNLKVTELHYHPSDSIAGSDTVSGKSFEFIEIKNVGSHSVDLSGLYFVTGINFSFPSGAMLAPNDFYVIASSSKWFFERYGVAPSEAYRNSLSNTGEVISVFSADNREIFNFGYSEQDPWPTDVSGSGFSLTSAHVYPTGNPAEPAYWKVSSYVHGSPFYDDNGFPLADEEFENENFSLKVYPNPTADLLFFDMGSESKMRIEIYTPSGQRIHQELLYQNTFIDLNYLGLDAGLLLVKVSGQTGTVVRKIVFQP